MQNAHKGGGTPNRYVEEPPLSTRPLPSHRHAAGRRPVGSGRLVTSTVPSFKLAFPAPPGYGVNHEFYELRQAANRVYQSRRAAYRTMSQQLDASEMLDYVRQDVMMRLLEVETKPLGPFRIARFRWVDATKFRAWLPYQRRQVEALYGEFRRKILDRLPGLDLGKY